MELRAALGVSAGDVVAFVGAGGKSAAILAVARELGEAGMKVLVAPTTKMFLGEAHGVGPLVVSEDADELRENVGDAFSGGASGVVAGSALISKNRVGGVEPGWVASLASLADVALVEADGSRRRPLKGTAAHEPVLPQTVTLVVAVGNVRALGAPVDEDTVHRPEIFSELTGVGPGQSVTARAFAAALAKGSLGTVPKAARRAVLITGVQPGPSMAEASVVTRELWRLGVDRVALTSLPEPPPTQVWIT